MTSGVVFDIREFTVHDGPGIRTTVFLKGCPLSCTWCHNPEGLDPRPEVMCSSAGERVVGRSYEATELAQLLQRQADVLAAAEGGVTFSGGEPLMQARFVAEVIDLLPGVHVVLDTSGYGSERSFVALARRSDLIYFDLKLVDPAAHRRWTGRDNGPILRNLARLEQARYSVRGAHPDDPGRDRYFREPGRHRRHSEGSQVSRASRLAAIQQAGGSEVRIGWTAVPARLR